MAKKIYTSTYSSGARSFQRPVAAKAAALVKKAAPTSEKGIRRQEGGTEERPGRDKVSGRGGGPLVEGKFGGGSWRWLVVLREGRRKQFLESLRLSEL